MVVTAMRSMATQDSQTTCKAVNSINEVYLSEQMVCRAGVKRAISRALIIIISIIIINSSSSIIYLNNYLMIMWGCIKISNICKVKVFFAFSCSYHVCLSVRRLCTNSIFSPLLLLCEFSYDDTLKFMPVH